MVSASFTILRMGRSARRARTYPAAKEQAESDDEEHHERIPQTPQVGVTITVISRSSHYVVLFPIVIYHAYSLVSAYVELYLPPLQYLVDHRLSLLDDVVVDGIMIEHGEVGGINSHPHLIDELLVVEIHRLHCGGIHLSRQKKIGLCDGLVLEVAEECLVSRVLAQQIDECHAEQQDGGCDACILQCEGCPYLHALSVRMKPTPGLVCMSLVSKSLSIFLRR